MTVIGVDAARIYRQLVTTADTLRPDDRARLLALWALDDPCQLPAALLAYYRDLDRADRTPRSLLYLHLGWLAGLIPAPDDEAGQGEDQP